MRTNPVADALARRRTLREELVVNIRELEGQLARAYRRLGEVSAEIDSLRRVEQELLRRHPELWPRSAYGSH
jgi:hypothetical protein